MAKAIFRRGRCSGRELGGDVRQIDASVQHQRKRISHDSANGPATVFQCPLLAVASIGRRNTLS
jgi:hypothetical protein